MVKSGSRARRIAILASSLLLLPACGWGRMPMNRFMVTDQRADGANRDLFEDFPEGYYRIGEDGLVDIVLHRPAHPTHGPDDGVIQTIHIQAYWQAQPGRTHARDGMLNSMVTYCLQRGYSGITYDGGGFVRYEISGKEQALEGFLSRSELQPLRRAGEDLSIFHRAALSGRFQARCDPRRTNRLIRQIDQALGNLPPIEPEVTSPAL